MLLHRQRVVGAALHRRVVDDDDAFPALDPADAGDDPRRGDLLLIDAMRRELGELEEGRAGVQQELDALAGRELAAGEMARHGFLPAALLDDGDQPAQILDEALHRLSIGAEARRAGIDVRCQLGHGPVRIPACRTASITLPPTRREPAIDMLQPVMTPEGLAVDNEEGRAEDTAGE